MREIRPPRPHSTPTRSVPTRARHHGSLRRRPHGERVVGGPHPGADVPRAQRRGHVLRVQPEHEAAHHVVERQLAHDLELQAADARVSLHGAQGARERRIARPFTPRVAPRAEAQPRARRRASRRAAAALVLFQFDSSPAASPARSLSLTRGLAPPPTPALLGRRHDRGVQPDGRLHRVRKQGLHDPPLDALRRRPVHAQGAQGALGVRALRRILGKRREPRLGVGR